MEGQYLRRRGWWGVRALRSDDPREVMATREASMKSASSPCFCAVIYQLACEETSQTQYVEEQVLTGGHCFGTSDPLLSSSEEDVKQFFEREPV